ncbi:phage tail repeat-like family [Trichomonas vaginalis G3]|uniref:phage tail repeat-like family n=2 Tax=Trichomonas vaginalis (strain ATCC PRA-98 / G3) TaxID=412133 RepID=UPI0021E62375|nr:phage tail repeat-like family [Trichomonas vaginalis G3]KAI5498047.1 phage tail repeat-like family [Trichomonas vaginalis G3]
MSKDIASMREIQHNRQLIMQALNKNTTNFSNYSKISESLKEGNLKLTINPMTDEFLFQDNKNHTVCINPTKGTLNEKPINELLLKADVDNKADKEYVDDAIAKEEERANNAYATKEHTHPELADKTYVDNKMSSEVTRAENEYSKKTHTHSISEITDLNVSLEKKADKDCVASALEKKADKEYVDEKDNEIIERVEWYHGWTSKILKTKADTGWVSGCLDLKTDKTYVNDELEKKANKTYVNEIYQSLIGTTKNIETIVGDFSFNEENKYFRWQFVHSLKNGIRYKLIPKNNNEMYVSYIKNDGTQVKVPLDNNCYLNLYGDEQKKYFRVYEMADMTLPDPAPAPYYYDYVDDEGTLHADEQKQTLYLDYYRYKRYNAIEKTRIVYYYI